MRAAGTRRTAVMYSYTVYVILQYFKSYDCHVVAFFLSVAQCRAPYESFGNEAGLVVRMLEYEAAGPGKLVVGRYGFAYAVRHEKITVAVFYFK